MGKNKARISHAACGSISLATSIMEEWKVGRMEGWKNGRLEEWKGGRVEGWKGGSPLCPMQNFEGRVRLGGLRSLAAVEAALGLVSPGIPLFRFICKSSDVASLVGSPFAAVMFLGN